MSSVKKFEIYFVKLNQAGQCTMKFSVQPCGSSPNELVGKHTKTGWTHVSEDVYNQTQITASECGKQTIKRIIDCGDR